jgi:hypothetical protein
MLTINYLVKVTNQWVYVHIDKIKNKLIDQQGYYLPTEATSNYHPTVHRAIYDILEDNYLLRFCVANANSYPATLTNTIMTAELISSE